MVTHDYPPRLGGIASHVFELSKYLVKHNNNIVILTPENDGKKYEPCLPGIKVIRVKSEINYYAKTKIRLWYDLITYGIKAKLMLNNLIKDVGLDVIHYHNTIIESLITKGVKKVPVVFTAHESYFLSLAELKKKRLYYYLSHPDFLIAPSKELLEKAREFGVFPKGYKYIPNGVDVDKFAPKENIFVFDKIGVNNNVPTILSARRLEPKNGVEYLIRALPLIIDRIPDTKLIIVGDGSQRDYLQNIAKQLNVFDSIVWFGARDNSEMSDVYNSVDVVALPSLQEATSITGLEAMACGKPLVGTEVGGIPEIILKNITGYLVPPRDVSKLAEKIVMVLSNSKRRKELGQAARNYVVQNFSWHKIAEQTNNIYQSLA